MDNEQIKKATKNMKPAEAEIFRLTQRVMKLETEFNQLCERVSDGLSHKDYRMSEIETNIKRLDIGLSVYTDLSDRISSLEETRLKTLPIKKNFWSKLFK